MRIISLFQRIWIWAMNFYSDCRRFVSEMHNKFIHCFKVMYLLCWPNHRKMVQGSCNIQCWYPSEHRFVFWRLGTTSCFLLYTIPSAWLPVNNHLWLPFEFRCQNVHRVVFWEMVLSADLYLPIDRSQQPNEKAAWPSSSSDDGLMKA